MVDQELVTASSGPLPASKSDTRLQLDPNQVTATIHKLCLRIHDRFPESGLYKVCLEVHRIAGDTQKTVRWIDRPNWLIKTLSLLSILALIGLVGAVVNTLGRFEKLTVVEFIQTSDSGVNLLIFLSLALYFLWTLDLKLKRQRIVKSINTLRELAHIVDMHQLTKDPDGVARVSSLSTPNSPKRTMSAFELGRYLDYCTEILSLLSKLAYLYQSYFQDPVAASMASELETLTSSQARKIWQKIIVLRNQQGQTTEAG